MNSLRINLFIRKRAANLLVLGLLMSGGICSTLRAEEVLQAVPPAVKFAAAPNAAVVYWQAFYIMPNLPEEQKKLLDAAVSSNTTPLTDDLKPIVARYRIALQELQRARRVTPCDWQLDLSAGPELLLPHVQKARELSRVALLRARQRFAEGQVDAALDDIVATLKMARDCASSPILIALLVDAAIEKSAIELLASHLSTLSKAQLNHLERELTALPPSATVASAIQWEGQTFGGWLKRKLEAEVKAQGTSPSGEKLFASLCMALGVPCNINPQPDDLEGQRKARLIKALSVADLHNQIDQLSENFMTLSKIAALPFDQRKAEVDAFEKSLEAAKGLKDQADLKYYLASVALASIGNVINREEQILIRRQLLEQAIQVQRDGESSLQPIHGKKVQYQKTPHGFELSTPSSTGDVNLTIGSQELAS